MKGRRIIPLAATAALACGGTMAVAPAAHADWEGTITGKIVNADGTPAYNVYVSASKVAGSNAGTNSDSDSGRTDRNGVYRIDVEQNAQYSVAPSIPAVTPQTVTATNGTIIAVPTFTLAAPTPSTPMAVPSDYSAVVSVTGGSAPSNDIEVKNTSTGEWYDADLATDGRYYVTGAPAGNYKIDADGYSSNGEYVGTVWSGGKTNERDATVVAVGDKTDLGSLAIPSDKALGTVTGSIAFPHVAGFDEWSSTVVFYGADGGEYGTLAGGTDTDATGNFSVDLAPGTYYATASGRASQVTNFAAQLNGTAWSSSATEVNTLATYSTALAWYGGSMATAKKIVVGPNGTVSGVNFSLTNSLKPVVKPMIKGKFKKGKKISVTTGTWNQTDDLAFSYVWKEGSKIVGTSPSLKLSKKVWKKVGKLRVVVTVMDKNGDLATSSVALPVKKTIKAQVKAAKKQLKKDTKKDNKAVKQASKV